MKSYEILIKIYQRVHPYLRIDTKTVHPVPVHLLLSRLLNSVHLNNDVFFGRIQSWEVVEQVCYKSQVETLLTLDHILGSHECSGLDLVRLLQHRLRPLQQVNLGHGLLVDTCFSWSNLIDQLCVDLTVLDVIMKIANSSVGPSLRKYV